MHALIIKDEFLIAALIEDALRERGFTSFDIAVSDREALAAANLRCPDLITSDVQLQPGCGITTVLTICSQTVIPVIFITGKMDDVRRRAPQHVVLAKPFVISTFHAAVASVMPPTLPETL